MSETELDQPVANPIQSPDSSAKRLLWRGVVATIAYAALVATYIWFKLPELLVMKPDAFATFVSGAIAPLGFLWLVLGFMQQGDELQNSARALWLQGEELRNSVEQQRQLVEVSRQQLEAERDQRMQELITAEHSSQPKLVLTARGGMFMGSGEAQFGFGLTSAGPICHNVTVFAYDRSWFNVSVIQEGYDNTFQYAVKSRFDLAPMPVVITYTDRNNNHRKMKFLVPVVDHGGNNEFGEPVLIEGPTPRD